MKANSTKNKQLLPELLIAQALIIISFARVRADKFAYPISEMN